MINVVLTDADLERAKAVAIQRRESAVERRRAAAHGISPDAGYKPDLQGAYGELACSIARNIPWDPIIGLDTDRGDLADGSQVRATRYRTGALPLHRTDADEDIFYLVRGTPPRFEVVGFISGHRGKAERFWETRGHDDRPCFFVPAAELVAVWGPRYV